MPPFIITNEKLDRVFSIFIRLKYADYRGYIRCYTCGAIGHWKTMQCGHFIRRGNEAVRWDEDNAMPQCISCNMTMGGREDIFEQELRYDLGEEGFNALLERSRCNYPNEKTKLKVYQHYNSEIKKNPLYTR